MSVDEARYRLVNGEMHKTFGRTYRAYCGASTSRGGKYVDSGAPRWQDAGIGESLILSADKSVCQKCFPTPYPWSYHVHLHYVRTTVDSYQEYLKPFIRDAYYEEERRQSDARSRIEHQEKLKADQVFIDQGICPSCKQSFTDENRSYHFDGVDCGGCSRCQGKPWCYNCTGMFCNCGH